MVWSNLRRIFLAAKSHPLWAAKCSKTHDKFNDLVGPGWFGVICGASFWRLSRTPYGQLNARKTIGNSMIWWVQDGLEQFEAHLFGGKGS